MKDRGPIVLAVTFLLAIACGDQGSKRVAQAFQVGASHPDEEPKVLNTELPFRYPAALYARKIQGNVTLRLLVDTTGQVNADSTRIEESSGYASLDSAAVKGSLDLRFVPAKLHGDPIATTVLFPVYFRHPEARALPGDTILNKRATP